MRTEETYWRSSGSYDSFATIHHAGRRRSARVFNALVIFQCSSSQNVMSLFEIAIAATCEDKGELSNCYLEYCSSDNHSAVSS